MNRLPNFFNRKIAIKILAILTIIAICSPILIGIPSVNANILGNGGFELGNFSGWGYSHGYVNVTLTSKHTGSFGVEGVYFASTPHYREYYVDRDLFIDTNDISELSFYYKIETGHSYSDSGHPTFTVVYTDTTYDQFALTNAVWTQKDVFGDLDANKTIEYIAFGILEDANYGVYWDDFVLTVSGGYTTSTFSTVTNTLNEDIIGEDDISGTDVYKLDNESTYFYPYLSPYDYKITINEIASRIIEFNSTTYSSGNIYLGLYQSDSNEISALYPLELKSYRGWAIVNGTTNYTISYNPEFQIEQNRIYAIAIATDYDSFYIQVATNPDTYMESTNGKLPATIDTFTPSQALVLYGHYFFAILITNTVTITPTCSTTLTITHTVTTLGDPATSTELMVRLAVSLMFIFPISIIFGKYAGSTGLMAGLAISVGLLSAISILPYWFVIFTGLILVVLLFRRHESGSSGDSQ